MNIGERLRWRRKELDMTLEEVAQMINISRQTLSRYENGIISNIPSDKIEALAKALKTSPAYIMGWEDSPAQASNLIPISELHMKKIPLIGTIACGTPILAEENITDYIDAPGHIRADFALMCRGDSMIGADIRSGDIVFIRQQPEVSNGQIAAVLVEDEATLKRFYHSGTTVTLLAENPEIAPLVYAGEELEHLHVIGLAVATLHQMEP